MYLWINQFKVKFQKNLKEVSRLVFLRKGYFGGSDKIFWKGVDNIYTEHKPHLKDIIDLLLQNKLKEIEFPYAPGSKTVLTKP